MEWWNDGMAEFWNGGMAVIPKYNNIKLVIMLELHIFTILLVPIALAYWTLHLNNIN